MTARNITIFMMMDCMYVCIECGLKCCLMCYGLNLVDTMFVIVVMHI